MHQYYYWLFIVLRSCVFNHFNILFYRKLHVKINISAKRKERLKEDGIYENLIPGRHCTAAEIRAISQRTTESNQEQRTSFWGFTVIQETKRKKQKQMLHSGWPHATCRQRANLHLHFKRSVVIEATPPCGMNKSILIGRQTTSTSGDIKWWIGR